VKPTPYYYGVRDKGNYLKGWFATEEEAKDFVKRHDTTGEKGFHVLKVN
jgi:hypothetical protein